VLVEVSLLDDELSVADELPVDEEELAADSRSLMENPVPVEDEPSADDGPPEGGGPGGGPPAPPAPPGPPANVLLKRFWSSVAWSLVKAPLETWSEIRLSILDLISPGPELLSLVELELSLDEEDDRPAERELSMLVSADDNAVSSLELTVPADTSDWSSACSRWRGLYALDPTLEMDVIKWLPVRQ
jgi:hypothetical protein